MLPLSLQALASATGTDPNDASELALDARARARKSLMDVDQRAQQPIAPDALTAYNRDMQGVADTLGGGTNAQWAPFFEAVNEAGDRAGKKVSIGDVAGLPTDTEYGTLPLSLQGLSGAAYGYDAQGLPNKVVMSRRGAAGTPITQPKPRSLG